MHSVRNRFEKRERSSNELLPVLATDENFNGYFCYSTRTWYDGLKIIATMGASFLLFYGEEWQFYFLYKRTGKC